MTRTKVTVSWPNVKYETELDRELLEETLFDARISLCISKFREITRYEKNTYPTFNAKS